MLDSKLLREHLEEVVEKLAKRGFEFPVQAFKKLDKAYRQCLMETQSLQTERNARSKLIGQKKSQGEDVSTLFTEMENLNHQLKRQKERLDQLQGDLDTLLARVPNIPHESVPDGCSEADNKEIRSWGEVPKFDFTVKDHVELGESLGLMDFKAAAKISGARFVVLHQQLARLQRALIQFMLDLHTQSHGYQEVYVPYLVKDEALFGTGQLPKFKEDLFQIEGDFSLNLIPTAEVPLTNLVREQILNAQDLPLKFVAHTPCFRSEAGSYGKDTRGIIRQHQFEKVELVQVVKPESSYNALEELTAHAETVLQQLELPYRVVSLCAGDLGAIATKTYDLEVWIPSQNTYREISSCSNFEAFHARRMNTRFKEGKEKPVFVHTLNGSALAVGRTLVAILENYQDKKGNIHVPKALQPYLGGISFI
jgi:seryl-tRNA synthetase